MFKVKVKRINVVPGGLKGFIQSVLGEPSYVEVGVIDQGASYDNGMGVEQAAIINMNGTAKIPPRNWIQHTLDVHGDEYTRLIKKMLKGVMFRRADRRAALSQLGGKAQGDIRKIIRDWKIPVNAPKTIAKKGFDNPLVHTKLLQKLITWRIK